MEEKNQEQFEAVEPLAFVHGTCLHESSHTQMSGNVEEGTRSVLVVSSRMAMHVAHGALEVRFARHAFLHPGLAVQVRR